jgi:two-component system, LytTR family, sensor kinase
MIDVFGDGRYLSVNIIGHATGVLIFGIFLALMLSHRSAQQVRASWLSLLAVALALVWNLASLAVIVLGNTHEFVELIVAGIGFCALSVLPSVLLDLCLRRRLPVIVRLGYGLSLLAVVAHIIELFLDAAEFHRLGLAIITIGFGLLSVASVLAVLWSAEDNPRGLSTRLLSAMSLFLFAISFVHFNNARSPDAWLTELAVHHGGIILALFVIMQDYRFIFLDAFVRFLVNGLLAVVFAVGTAWV